MLCKTIAHIETDFTTKFGVPRQAGLIPELEGRIIFEPEYRIADALRGLEGYSHLWLIWEFHEVRSEELGVRSYRNAYFSIKSTVRIYEPALTCFHLPEST